MKVQFHCHYGALTGYGRAARDYMLAIKRHTKTKLFLNSFDSWESPEKRYSALDGIQPGEAHVDIFSATPRALAGVNEWPSSCKNPVAFTTWETGILPKEYVEGLNRYKAVITPSHYCTRIIKHALDVPVFTVPHCIDLNFWAQKEGVADNEYFTFYSVGSWNVRKNMDGLLKAYLHAFTKNDPVILRIHSMDVVENHVMNMIVRSGVQQDLLPRLVVSRDSLDEEELRAFHYKGDCYVNPGANEGWGLAPFEGAVVGNPLVSPVSSGLNDWTHYIPNENIRQVDVDLQPAFIGPLGRGVPGQNCKQLWFETNTLALSYQMRAEFKKERAGAVHNKDLRKNCSYKTVSGILMETLEEVLQ